MPKFRFEIDWVDAQGVSGPELSATWASMRVLAGDSAVTRVLDTRAQTVREFVFVPLYPLAEWLVTNWWFLSYEIATPAKEGDPDFHRRHALSANREGYAFPNLEVVPSGTRTHASSRAPNRQSPYSPDLSNRHSRRVIERSREGAGELSA